MTEVITDSSGSDSSLNDSSKYKELSDISHTLLWRQGLWQENPALVKLLGLCPLLAVSNSVTNALALGIATALTLLISNLAVSLLRNYLIHTIRLPVYVLIIASSVTSIELLMQAWLPALHGSLGIFLPLIVTNCLIIGRAEAFASRHRIKSAGIDALAMGIGFSWVLICLGALRELIGNGTLLSDAHLLFGEAATHWTITLLAPDHTMLIAILPPGAFLILGSLLALKNFMDAAGTKRK